MKTSNCKQKNKPWLEEHCSELVLYILIKFCLHFYTIALLIFSQAKPQTTETNIVTNKQGIILEINAGNVVWNRFYWKDCLGVHASGIERIQTP